MILKAVTVFAEGIFEDETHVVHPKRDNISSKLKISLLPPKDILLDIHIRVSLQTKLRLLPIITLLNYNKNNYWIIFRRKLYSCKLVVIIQGVLISANYEWVNTL